jgi:putative glutamine amidotransferase
VPVVLAPLDNGEVGSLLDRLAGLCLSGGPDLDPDVYGGRYHQRLGPTEPQVDRFELDLLRGADEREMPVLAICRGSQALNVARGGTLIMDLPSRRKPTLEHRQKAPGEMPTHEVEIDRSSQLWSVIRRSRIRVNSFHHQAVRRVGRGLRAVAWAPDGVIEAVEDPSRDFVVGVQWHAEGLARRIEQARLFDGFIQACRRYAAAGAEARAA